MESKSIDVEIPSSDPDSNCENIEPPKKKSRGCGLDWNKVEVFGTLEECKNYMKTQKFWMKRKISTELGNKTYYHCKYSKDCSMKFVFGDKIIRVYCWAHVI